MLVSRMKGPERMLDRLFAVWKSMHQGTSDGQLSNPEEAKAHLVAFRRSPGFADEVCWTSNESRDCKSFGYEFEEIKNGGDIWKRFNDLYQWSVPISQSGD